MAQILRFESNGYHNLKLLFADCESVETCDFCLEMVETMANKGNITESEKMTLRRIGRSKRKELIR